ncbi:MAG: TonB-dependent receptor plug domain-containing protein, partial [Asticcacaulis sp.]
ISTLVNETPGIRVQPTAPALGGANIRIQGMPGRYTLLLMDGLPIYGGQSLGLMQIPPTDLGRVEVIKGAVSALYGASALGGVINLVSRRPGPEPETELLLNLTHQGGQDATVYQAGALSEQFGASLTAGVHGQSARDRDKDGWRDLAAYRRWTVRPRLFWYGEAGQKALMTLGAMGETRTGGAADGARMPDGQPFVERQVTRRYDAGLNAQSPLEGLGTLSLKASAMSQTHQHQFGPVRDTDEHLSGFAELTLAGASASKAGAAGAQSLATSWVAGVVWQSDHYHSRRFDGFDYHYDVPGLFAQVEQSLSPNLIVSASGRVDQHSRYGTQVSPRVSLLYRRGPWSLRTSLGRGYSAPTPFVETIEAAGFDRLEPLGSLRPETANTASVDLAYSQGAVEAGLVVFGADLERALRIETVGPERVRLVNGAGITRNRGAELRLKVRHNQLSVSGSYVYVDATEQDPASGKRMRRAVPGTPRHTGGVVAIWEAPGRGRLGFEAYYTGRQALEDHPTRIRSKPYWELGLLAEAVIPGTDGRSRVFLNAENLLDVRQTRYERIIRSRRAADGRWTLEPWAPTEGFVLNGGVRLSF